MVEIKENLMYKEKERRARVCFKWREYILIFENNHFSEDILKQFNALHSGHPVQTVNELELMQEDRFKKPFTKLNF